MKRMLALWLLALGFCIGLRADDAELVKMYLGEQKEGIPVGFAPMKYERSRSDVVSVGIDRERKMVMYRGDGVGVCQVTVYGENQQKKTYQIKVIKDLRPLARQLDGQLQELGGAIDIRCEDEKVVIEGTLKSRGKWLRYQELKGGFRGNLREIEDHMRLDCLREVEDSLQKVLNTSAFRLRDKTDFELNLKESLESKADERFKALAKLRNTGYLETIRKPERTDIYFRAYVSSEKVREDILKRWNDEIKTIPAEAQCFCHDDVQIHVIDPESLVAELSWQLRDKGFKVVETPAANGFDILWFERRHNEFETVAVVKGTVLSDASKKSVDELVAGTAAKIKELGNVGALEVRSEVKSRVEMLDISFVYVALDETELKQFGSSNHDGTLINFDLSALFSSIRGKDSEAGQVRQWTHRSSAGGSVGIGGTLQFLKENGVNRMREAAHLRFRSDSKAKLHQGGTIVMQVNGENPTVHEIGYGIQIEASVAFEGSDKLKMKLKYDYSSQPSGSELVDITDKLSYDTTLDLTLDKTLVTVGKEMQSIDMTGPSGLAVARKIPVLNWLTSQELKAKERLHLLLLIHPRILTPENSGEEIEVAPLDQNIIIKVKDPDKKPETAPWWKFWKWSFWGRIS